MKETTTAFENLWKALEQGQSVEMIAERLEQRKREKEDLEAQIAIERNKEVNYSAPRIRAFLHSLVKGNQNDEANRKAMINIFLQAVYLWDSKMTLILNGGDKPIEIDGILLDEIEANNVDVVCSHMGAAAPPLPHEGACFHGGFLCSITCEYKMRRAAAIIATAAP